MSTSLGGQFGWEEATKVMVSDSCSHIKQTHYLIDVLRVSLGTIVTCSNKKKSLCCGWQNVLQVADTKRKK